MGKLRKNASRFLSDESGAEITEFAVVLAVVAGLVALLIILRGTIGNKLTDATRALDNVDVNSAVNG